MKQAIVRYWRPVLIDGPALIVKGLFTYWLLFLGVVTILNVLNITLYVMAWLLERPVLWAH